MTGSGDLQGGATRTLKAEGQHRLLFAERDRSLLKDGWPNTADLPADAWELSNSGKSLTRTLLVEGERGRKPDELSETILRFPSLPIHAVHRPPEYPYKIEDEWPNYHTLRVLHKRGDANSRARHVFLLHNGLNETREMSFHHRMASWILNECDEAVCILRPLPSHLTRYPFQGPLSEQPLDEYLRDPAQVFRQFLRYMIETRWLLSALVHRKFYDISTGCSLLLDHKRGGRNNPTRLAEKIAQEANLTLGASEAKASKKEQKERRISLEKIDAKDVEESIKVLRGLIGWQEVPNRPPQESKIDEPTLHVVGYSMGGFFAQSIFCAWPFAIASCSNLFAGGAIRDLAPTAFAHPEEWQTVLHGLRYELDEARAEGLFKPKDKNHHDIDEPSSNSTGYVFGIEREIFEYLNRIFEDVFLQTDRGGYTTRLAEFSRRLLFILGGDDPIVRTRNVLDAAPPGGITLHQIGDVSHFPGGRGGAAEIEQRKYWLPEAGRMIARFAEKQAAKTLQGINAHSWGGAGYTPKGERLPIRMPADRSLSNMLFEQELDSMVDMINSEPGGWLFIARNQIPTVFLGSRAIKSHATAMHHSEDLIQEYVASLETRARKLETDDAGGPTFTLLIPSALMPYRGLGPKKNPLLERASDRAKFSKSETAIRYWPDEDANSESRNWFLDTWCQSGAVHAVDQREYESWRLGDIGEAWAKGQDSEAEKISVTMLPDVWFAADMRFLAEYLECGFKRKSIEPAMVQFASKLAAERRRKKPERLVEQELAEQMKRGAIRFIKVSATEFNPRFRGRLLDGASEADSAAKLLIYWAMSYQAVNPISGPVS